MNFKPFLEKMYQNKIRLKTSNYIIEYFSEYGTIYNNKSPENFISKYGEKAFVQLRGFFFSLAKANIIRNPLFL
jgi:hypothetical protein